MPDGIYRMRVLRRDEGRVIDSQKQINVDRQPPRAALLSARPSVIAPGEPGQQPEVRLRYRGPSNEAPVFRVFRTGDGPPRLVLRFRGNGNREAVWDGRLREGRAAPEGDYAFTVQVRDRAGNPTEAPAPTPSARTARAGNGRVGQALHARGAAGRDPGRRRGSPAGRALRPLLRLRPVAAGVAAAGGARASGSAGRSGCGCRAGRARASTSVRVRAGDRRAVWPLAVAGLPADAGVGGPPATARGAAGAHVAGPQPRRRRPRRLRRTRCPARGACRSSASSRAAGSPPGFRSESAPLLRFLDRAGLDYDLTTDLSLARGEGPALGNAPGRGVRGSALWLPPALGQAAAPLRGGRRAGRPPSARTRFRRDVGLGRESFGPAAPPRRANVFGERTALLRTGAAPLGGVRGRAGAVRRPQRPDRRLHAVRALREPAAGRARCWCRRAARPTSPPSWPSASARAWCCGPGTPQWSRELEEARLSVEVPRVTRRIWALLSGRGELG